MAKSIGKNIIDLVTSLALPICETQGITLWDVEFKKEGPDWFLRFFIDKQGGVGLDDCERFSRAIDPVLDEADPVEQNYFLEVSSPGIERVLKKPEHFYDYIGAQVEIKFFKAFEGQKVFAGTLTDFNEDKVTIRLENDKTVTALLEDTAYVRLSFSF